MVAIAEIAVAIAVVGWFLTPTIKELIDSARSSLGSRYKWYTGLPTRLQELAGTLYEINLIVGAAKGNFINDPAMIDLLWGLKDAIHDAEELLDTFQYEILDANLNLEKRHPVKRAMYSTVDFGKQVIGTKKSLNKLKKLVKQLGLLRQSSGDLVQASQRGSRPIWRPVTAPLPRKDKLFGYDKKYEDLVSSLISGDGGCSSRSVVAIIGHAGTGKTELARKVYHDPKLEFNLRIWVSVYAKFSPTELLREIWGSTPIEAKPRDSRMRESENMNLTSLQEELTKMMKSGWRCLLVLDDVCNNESSYDSDLSRRKTWDKVLAPFEHHSRILITSRAEICCKTLGSAGAPIVLDGIDTAAITLLLKKACFGDEHAAVPDNLQGLFDKHVLKTHGSPLAAEEVGCMLEGSLDPAKWKDKLNSGYPDGVRHAHLSSYQDLPPHLQRCFAFCSIFPISWRFQQEKLIRMWVALGFVECSLSESGGKTTEEEEDVAREYFHALLQRSFFKEAATVKGKSDSGFYVIQEHTHSMLRLVSPRTYLSIDANRDKGALIPLTVRHLSVTTSCLGQLKHSGEPTKLRTLLVFDDDASTSSPKSARVTAIDNGVLKKFKGVRVLDFSDTSIAQLPESVGELKHLRYLDLPNTITKLGCHVTKLLLLQTFGVNDKKGSFHELKDLPDEMSNLTNLRHLDLYLKCIEKVQRIGRLGKLQGSVEFRAGKKEEGHGIRELEKLNSLRRMLSIKGLETVTGTEEAESAELRKKQHLKVLKLEWGQRTLQQQNQRGAAANDDSAVLQGLEPHPNLEKLHIIRYLGTETPDWLVNPRVLENLRALYLTNCRNLQVLPLVGVIPRLELLTISELCSVKRIDCLFSSGAFSSLEKMVIYDMPMLDAWNEGVSNDTPTLFPRLRVVKIVHCPELCSVAGLLSCRLSLVELRVEKCPKITQTFSKTSFPLLNDFSKLLGCPGLQFEDAPPAEGASAPCPTQDGGRCPVPTSYHLFIFVSICLLYSIVGSFFSTAIM